MSDNPKLFDTVTNYEGQLMDAWTYITLQDLFAAFATAGIVSHGLDHTEDTVARWAYAYADAMLAERERTNK